LLVEGYLNADASDKSPITFTSDDSWEGLKFFDTSDNNLINNCDITGATVCGIEIINSSVTIMNSKIYENTSDTQKSPGIDITLSDNVTIQDNIIANNESTSLWGGFGIHNSAALISHNIIVNNTADYASAFHITDDAEPTIINNTIANNEINSSFGAAIWINSGCYPTFKNTIVIDSEDAFANYGSPTVTYSCVSGGFSGTGNIDADPLFAAPSAGDGVAFDGLNADWNLTLDSPCIDTGDPNSPQDPDGTRADMGALFYNQFSVDDPNNQQVVVLKQNYPNPVNTSTTFNYQIVKGNNSPVEIEIYNINGQLVDRITGNDGEANWKPDNIQSGIYFYKLKNADQVESRKLLLIK